MSLDDFLAKSKPAPAPPSSPSPLPRSEFNSHLALLYADARYTMEPPFIKVLHFLNGSDRSEYLRRFDNFLSKYGPPPGMFAISLPHKDIKTKCAIGFHRHDGMHALTLALQTAMA